MENREKELTDIVPQEQLPEDFRPVIPEPEMHRRPILQFSKEYEDDSPTSTHELSFHREQARKKMLHRLLYAIALAIIFIITFIITDACIKISNTPLPPTTAYVPKTQAQVTEQITSETENITE